MNSSDTPFRVFTPGFRLGEFDAEYQPDFICRKTPVAVKGVDYVVWALGNTFGVSRSSRQEMARRKKVKQIYRSWGSMRFHPKRRASTDHAPGPIIAKAAARVAAKT